MSNKLQLTENEFSLLCEVVASFHTIHDMDEMLLFILSKITSFFAIEGASIALHDPNDRTFFFIQTAEDVSGQPRLNEEQIRFPDDKGVAGWVMQHMQTALINDVSKNDAFFYGFNPDASFSTRSMICVPLKTSKGFLGVLYALNKIAGEFTIEEQRTLEILSGSIAVSLENARLFGTLKDHLQTLEREKELLQSQVASRFKFNEIIGNSQPMQKMFTLLEKVIGTPTTVLIQGETGTGKELIAKVIHYNGPLKDQAFVAENCGALPDGLLESELFGHVKGAFTGAVNNKKGLFEIADGGTIFLDEIGEMSIPMQVKLLRVLQEGQFRPVGSNTVQQVKVRVIASTNRNLQEEVQTGTFREDLFYRINVFQITPPPLRERQEDILLLSEFFLKKFAKRVEQTPPKLAPEATRRLMQFDWPGNVRELENEMERAITMAGLAGIITTEFLSDKLQEQNSTFPTEQLKQGKDSLKDIVRQIERQLVQQALENSQGNRTKAAQALGLSRQGLLNKITAYQITLH